MPSASYTAGSTGRWVHSTASSPEWRSSSTIRSTDFAVASSSESLSVLVIGQPLRSAYGATVSAQRVLEDVTIRETPYASSTRATARAWALPADQQWPLPVVLAPGLPRPRLAVPQHDQRPGLLARRRAPRARVSRSRR